MKELDLIFEKLKNKYNLTLTTTFALDDGYTIDVPVIRGISTDRRFDLYKEDDLFVFSVEFFEKIGEEKYSHAHPYDVNDAIDYIEKFMLRKSIFDAHNKKDRFSLLKRKSKLCDNCQNIKIVKVIKNIDDFFAILEYLKKLIENSNYEYDGGNNPEDTIKYWPQDGLWYRIKCKNCGAIYTLWYDTFKGKGCFKKGK